MYSETLLNNGGIVFICIYLFSLLFIGFLGHVFKKENSLEDFYLATTQAGLTTKLIETFNSFNYSKGRSLVLNLLVVTNAQN